MIRADLDSNWPRMFAQLPLAGPGLVMTRNEAAILGRRMTFPSLAFTVDAGKGADAESGLWLNFRMLGSARAVHIRSGEGNIFGVEFADVEERMVHRFTLTPASDLDAFFDWARLHQACSGYRVASRPETGDDSDPVGANHAMQRSRGAGAITPIIAACCERGLAVQATVRTSAVVQRALFVPTSLQAAGDWWFASDDTAGLHFHTGKFARIEIVEHVNKPGRSPLLLCHTDDHEPALILESGDDRQSGIWCELLYSFT